MNPTRPSTRRLALVAATAASAVLLAACGGNDSGSHSAHRSPSKSASSPGASASAGAHNAADVAFAKGMIPHHRQAVEMAGLAATRASSSQVKELATKIEQAQDPEIKTMSGWLTAWGEQVPEEMPGMDHSAHSGMAGMMSTKEMEALKKKSGKDFDTAFMEMMVEHHQGAVEMAGTEKKKGAHGPAKTLADAVIKAQNAEIVRMNKLLGKG
ncbi:DUF305 domain-containing protein [Streptomyces sp. Je 1-4]|uniref:DUF305 domain-containing protein n=1 Tax=Streptomyces TaxID=1883 RepID=UPI0021D9158A|nr:MULTISPECIES: DUF305 domain-containing protein [unclassified Streptomyces]UYB41052.1 DUF305 domain-containing protein [Streptomyces sp. Je 1-4]UZQ37216.1 DUF305 domain-containing protein [Streptomyces sp. Je 1-4] [Streptomyces sp. Je 1-4 4N24]UZQ44633.1 DUF305 domain-containing protein [Streptomyces sp. Je 1-4] [Streptomyces sp. Je 1-4 4N24_ara]